ncbi:MAG: hypothetical protein QXV84_03800 [Conexivisphaerales archaeon]
MIGLEFNIDEAVEMIRSDKEIFVRVNGSLFSLQTIGRSEEFQIAFFSSRDECLHFLDLGKMANSILYELWPKARVLVSRYGRSLMVWPVELSKLGILIRRIGAPLTGVKVEKEVEAYGEDILPRDLALVSVKGYTFRLLERGALGIHDIDLALARGLRFEGS